VAVKNQATEKTLPLPDVNGMAALRRVNELDNY